MKIKSTLNAVVNRLAKSAGLITLATVATFASPIAQAELNTSAGGWVAGMVSSGSAPFDQLDPSAGDAFVRTHDTVTYRVGFTTVNGTDTNARITARAGSFSVPGNYTGTALTQIGSFKVIDIPTSCVNVSTTPLTDPPAAGVSGVTEDGQTLFCAQASPTSGNNLDINFHISGTAPNGSIVSPISLSYSSDQTSSNSTPQLLEGLVGASTFYGLPDMTVRAEPRWNMRVGHLRGALYLPASGPNGEDGFVFSWRASLMALGSRKGLEALLPPYEFDIDFDDSDFPNAQFVNWDMQNPGYVSANFSSSGTRAHDGCGNWFGELTAAGNYFDNRYHAPNDTGSDGSSMVYAVANGGECSLTSIDTTSKTAKLSTVDTDFSLQHWPTKHGTNPAARTLVNPSDIDDTTNEWWTTNKTVLVWVPSDDIELNTTEYFTLSGQLNGQSITGQPNSEPDASDNASTPSARRSLSGSLSEIHAPPIWSNPYGMDHAPRDPTITGDSRVNQVAPNQLLATRIGAYNYSTSALPSGYICDRVDNTRLKLFDTRDPAFTASAAHKKDPNTGVFVRFLAGPEFPISWQVGVAPAWTSYNTVASEYSNPSRSGVAQADSTCADSDATWYNNIDELIAAEGADALEKVTHVRGSYDSYPSGSKLLIYIPQQANDTFAHSGVDYSGSAPASAFSQGENTIGSIATHQAMWQTNEPGMFTNGVGKASSAVRIFQTEYAQISKVSTSHAPSGSLVNVGEIVNYSLTINLSTSGSTHQSDVAVWDILPDHLIYQPGSSNLGGVTLPDPVCTSTGLPTAIFPAQGGTAAGEIPAGYSACYWSLPNQQVTKTRAGHSSANIPELTFKTMVKFDTPANTQLLTSAAVTSTNNLMSLPTYQGSEIGFACQSGRACSFSSWLLKVQATPGIVLSKDVTSTTIPVEGDFGYKLTYGAVGESLEAVRIIDIFPYQGDARSPSSTFTGTLRLDQPISKPVAIVSLDSDADDNFQALYTENNPADISADPYAAGHNISATGANSASETNWCTAGQFGQPNCPAEVADATAVMLFPDGANGSAARIAEGSSFHVNLDFQTSGNAAGDVYSNHFTADSPSLTARRPSSNTVTTYVKAPDLLVEKSVVPDTADAGEVVAFEILVKNNNDSNTSPVFANPANAIRVVDTLPAGLTISGTVSADSDWDCAASSGDTVDCSYTGSYPLGTGAAVGTAIHFNATLNDDVVDNAWIKNKASVSLSGSIESSTDNNEDEAWVRVTRAPDALLAKSIDRSTASQTEAVQYTLSASLSNDGGRALEGPLTVTDNLPAGLSISASSDASGQDWDCSASAPPSQVSCSYTGSFPVDAGASLGSPITVNTTVLGDATVGLLSNSASVQLSGDKNSDNNTASADVDVSAALAAIAGRVALDSDNDGQLQSSDTPIAGIDITLCRVDENPCTAANTVASTSSDADGSYRFDGVPQGQFYAIQSQPHGYGSSSPSTVAITRSGTADISGIDFAETLGKLSGFVYADLDLDGNRANTGESGVGVTNEVVLRGLTTHPSTGADVTVEIRATADPISGAYLIDNIPAPKAGSSYTLSQEPGTVDGFGNGSTTAGSLNASTGSSSTDGSADSASSTIDGITFAPSAAAVQAPTIDASDYNFGEIPQAGISGRVYLDADKNGSNDAQDPGLAGVTIVLCSKNERPCPAEHIAGTTQSAPDGSYLFNDVPVGSYFVQQQQPAAYGSTTANSLAVTRTGDQAVAGADFGERGAALVGQVFVDVDRSGNRSSGDTDYNQGTAEITLSGKTADGASISLTQTVDANGRYSFDNLAAPDAAGYTLSLNATTIEAPLFAAAAHAGAVTLANGSGAASGSVSELSVVGLSWPVDQGVATGNVATGFGYDFSVMSGVSISGKVMRDGNGNGTSNTSGDPDDTPQAGVSVTLCRSENNPCPADDVVATELTDTDGSYRFGDIMPGAYWVVQTQPPSLGNGPGASDILPATVGAGTAALENLDFLDRAGNLSGTVFRDDNANGSNDGETGLAGVTIRLSGTDIDGNAVDISVQTDADGNYRFTDLPAPDAAGYTLLESNEPANTRDGIALVGNALDAEGNNPAATGVASNADTITTIQLSPGGTGSGYDFSELPATASVSGSVWRDRDSDRNYSGDESAVPGWTVQLLAIDPVDGGTTVVAQQVTGNDGKYRFSGQTPGNYSIVFRAPTTDANGEPLVWGTPVNGERGVPVANSNADIGDGIIRSITLIADQDIAQQSLPLDPSGVVYDSSKRVPVAGAAVTLVGPAGFDPSIHLLGGRAAVSQTTSTTGEYQFLLLANAPAGVYNLDVIAPAGYSYASTVIPAESGSLTPPNGAAQVFPVVPTELAPANGEPTTYYTSFNLTPGLSSGVVHNHIPLDPQAAPVLFVTKQADRSTVELGDSIKYSITMYNRGTAPAPALAIEDTLPLGFRYIAGTAKLTRDGEQTATADPAGAPGPALLFDIDGTLPAGEELQLSYRVRVGVGADHSDGINRATGITGALRSEQAQAKVTVSGGVLGDEACLIGRVYVDCNNDQLQNGEEPGIPGVRLYMQDGRYLVTDVEGKYSSCDLSPQTHVLKVDPMTLPRASRLVTSSSRNVGDAGSLFVDLKAGELHRADFIEGSCTSMVLEQVRARRSNGDILQAHIEATGGASLSQRSNASGVQRGTVSADQTLVRERPNQAPERPLHDALDTPKPEQSVQAGVDFAHSTKPLASEAQGWDASNLHHIDMSAETDTSVADGLGAVQISLQLRDADDRTLRGRQLVTLIAEGAPLWLPGADTHEAASRAEDTDPAAPGVQAWVQDGQLQFSVLAPDQPKTVTVQAIAGNQRTQLEIAFNPALRQWIAAGLVEGIVRLNDEGGLSANGSDNGLFERELQEWQKSFNDERGSANARVAFFVKGTIKGKYLLTASYDSENQDDTRLLQDIQPEQLYPVFGDASVKGFEAQSSGNLFLRISRDKHYLLYGDFQSDSGSADLGANNRTLTGARLHLDGDKGLLDIYAANDSLRQRVEELTPNGTSGPYGLSALAVEGTERVELIVRDRNLRTRIIERRQLTRLVDYSFDPFAGRLLFKSPVSRSDENGNPQTIRVSYEEDGDGESALSAGVRAELQLTDWLRVGSSYAYNDLDAVVDDQLSELASADFTVAISEWLTLSAEAARSTTLAADGSGESSGNAARAEITTTSASGSWSAVLHAVQTDEEFRNANASAEAGRGEIGLRLKAAISDSVSINTELLHSSDESSDAEVDSAYLGLQLRPRDGFAVSAGIRHLQDNGLGLINAASIDSNGSVYQGSGLNSAGAGLFSSGESITSTADGDPLETTTLLLGANWALTDKLSLGLETENSFDGDESWRASATAGWKLNDKHRLHARYDTQTGLGSDVDRREKSRAFVFGLSRNFDADGSNFTELRLRDSISGEEAHLAYGVRNGFSLGSGLRGLASVEQVAILNGDGRTATSAAFGLSHTGGERWRGNARVEARRLHDDDSTVENDSADSWLANLSVARKLDRSWTALAKVIALGSDDKSQPGDQSQQRLQVGAAYRPVDSNRSAIVGKLERRRERNSELDTAESRDLWVASVNGNWHPTRAWWLGARLAGKDVDESLEGVRDQYRASLAGVRATYDISERTDIGVIGNYRYSPDGDTEDWAAGLEVGYAVKTNLWLSLGYNWGGFKDIDLSGADYTQRGWFIRLRYKFDEDLFNGASTSVNRSRPRSNQQQENEQ